MLPKISFTILFILFATSATAADFLSLFKTKKPAIAAVMIESSWKNQDDFKKAQAWSIEQARIAQDGGMDGILLEFRGGDILDRHLSKEHLDKMAELTRQVIASTSLVVGVEILWHFPGSTLLLAKNSGAPFVRLDFFSDQVIANKMEVPIDPKALLDYRKNIKAENVALLTDIQVKYSKMLNPKITIGQSALTAQTAGSDGVIVSGSKSGSSPAADKLKEAKSGALKIPVIIGSGFSAENASQLLPHLDAIIVGTSISEKTGGPLLRDKVTPLMELVKKAR